MREHGVHRYTAHKDCVTVCCTEQRTGGQTAYESGMTSSKLRSPLSLLISQERGLIPPRNDSHRTGFSNQLILIIQSARYLSRPFKSVSMLVFLLVLAYSSAILNGPQSSLFLSLQFCDIALLLCSPQFYFPNVATSSSYISG